MFALNPFPGPAFFGQRQEYMSVIFGTDQNKIEIGLNQGAPSYSVYLPYYRKLTLVSIQVFEINAT